MSEYTTRDAVDFALDKNASEFKSAIADVMMDKISSAIDARKIEVAGTLLTPQDNTTDEVEGQGEEDGSDEV